MSSSTLQAIWPGEKHENIREYHNSYGTAPIVWDLFCEKHLGLDSHWWLLNGTKMPNRLWDAWKNEKIPEAYRAVLLWTMDHIYVRRADYRRFGKDLRNFLDHHLISANRINHWPLIAQQFEMEPDYPALALWATSVISDPFNGEWNEDKQDYEPFDWSRASDLYDELNS